MSTPDVSTPDVSTPDASTPSSFPRRGGVGTLGPRPAATGSLRIVDDGFEHLPRTCAGALCVTGGWVR